MSRHASLTAHLLFRAVRALVSVSARFDGVPVGSRRDTIATTLERRMGVLENALHRRGYCCLCGARLEWAMPGKIDRWCCTNMWCDQYDGIAGRRP